MRLKGHMTTHLLTQAESNSVIRVKTRMLLEESRLLRAKSARNRLLCSRVVELSRLHRLHTKQARTEQ